LVEDEKQGEGGPPPGGVFCQGVGVARQIFWWEGGGTWKLVVKKKGNYLVVGGEKPFND